MWPFSGKHKTPKENVSIAQALEQLAAIGIRIRPGITQDDVLFPLDGTMDSPVDWVSLLCAIGGEIEYGQFERISDDLWHFDAECIEDNGDYVRVMERFLILTKGLLAVTDLRDHVDIENDEAWIDFKNDGQETRWNLQVSNDWIDPGFYTRFQDLVAPRGGGKKFFIAALGQDSLLCFGDSEMKDRLSQITGLEFQWE